MPSRVREVAIVSAGNGGNIASVFNAVRYVWRNVTVVTSPVDMSEDLLLILPGVGSFGAFMHGLGERGFIQPLRNAFAHQQPLLGICVGMQVLALGSSESPDQAGMGFVETNVRHLRELGVRNARIPHIGWSGITPNSKLAGDSPLGVLVDRDVYFMHSYALPSNAEASSAITEHEVRFSSAISVGCWLGVQFHPEKSHEAGSDFLSAWIDSMT